MKQSLKSKIIGFCVGALVAMGFTVLGLEIDIKLISMYDRNPYGSFMLYLLVFGLIIGWIVENRTTREMIRRYEER